MGSNSNFKSRALQEVHQNSASILQDHIERVNSTSEDIKTLERVLKSSAIPFGFVFVLSSNTHESKKATNYDYPEYFCVEERVERHRYCCLTWDSDKSNGYRLQYRIYRSCDTYEKESGNLISHGDIEIEFTRPLIETKSHIRLSVAGELEQFYQEITNALKDSAQHERVVKVSRQHHGNGCPLFLDFCL